MEREIKFRGKASKKNWVIGGYLEIYDSHCNTLAKIMKSLSLDSEGAYIVKKDTVGQFTGLHDKNGKEIYEKDIVRFGGFIGKPDFDLGVVEWFDRLCAFVVHPIDNPNLYVLCKDYAYTVVGNVYDNPELIEKEE